MSATEVYHQVRRLIRAEIDPRVDESSVERLSLLVTGMIGAQSASPAQIARALEKLDLREASAASLERRIRRTENDPEICAAWCFHPFARAHVRYGHPPELILILDPTTQEDRLVMVSVAVWYRGRALPLAWATWAGNTALEGDGLWTRIDALLSEVARLLPARVSITLLADRAFGCPAFLDLLTKRGWHYVVRVQGQTRCRDPKGRERTVKSLCPYRGKRGKLRGEVFKKQGWRTASVVAYWGRRHTAPLCLVTDLPPGWAILRLYRQRYAIEGTFRHYKRYGWGWEQSQVTCLAHLERLLVAMALATWIVLLVATFKAQQLLAQVPSGRRFSPPWFAKFSLFSLGLQQLHLWLAARPCPTVSWHLDDWLAPDWKQQLTAHHAHAFILA